ncbi:class I SAM-dependent methyltransferase [Halospina sp. K52047b]|uniref:class I SAM-dependent methyltransferase n=1 Tax=Halospina sp. K52047b TaxID=2614160 RepID=UPI0017887A5C|nr:class I SAM-dependent methyltransferase [Halospina sp. K52047b]
MRRQSDDTASISFTGLYTGEVWRRNDLAPQWLGSGAGPWLYRGLVPVEWLSRTLGGSNLRTILLQRHRIMDHLLERWIREEGVTQVLEIASGLSPRGHRFRQCFPELTYVETDMPGMAERKRRALEQEGALSEGHQVVPLNVFHREGPESMESVVEQCFRPGEPIVVITEGLTSYFTLEDMVPFWERIAALGARHPGSRYLMETYLVPRSGAFSRAIRMGANALGRLSDSDVTFHFADAGEVERVFRGAGFAGVRVHDPAEYREYVELPSNRGDAVVRVVAAGTG